MDSWELIFRQSRANDADYDGDRLAVQNWDWPRQTWFQERLRSLRGDKRRYSKEVTEVNWQQIR
jgi:hypothetical protein